MKPLEAAQGLLHRPGHLFVELRGIEHAHEDLRLATERVASGFFSCAPLRHLRRGRRASRLRGELLLQANPRHICRCRHASASYLPGVRSKGGRNRRSPPRLLKGSEIRMKDLSSGPPMFCMATPRNSLHMSSSRVGRKAAMGSKVLATCRPNP